MHDDSVAVRQSDKHVLAAPRYALYFRADNARLELMLEIPRVLDIWLAFVKCAAVSRPDVRDSQAGQEPVEHGGGRLNLRKLRHGTIVHKHSKKEMA